MTISITITGDTAAEVRDQAKALLNIGGSAPVQAPAPATTEPEAPAAAKRSPKKAADKAEEKKIEEKTPETPSETVAEEQAETFTREDLTNIIKALHKAKGDSVLPKATAIIEQFDAKEGSVDAQNNPVTKAKKQSHIKDEDLEAVITKLKELM